MNDATQTMEEIRTHGMEVADDSLKTVGAIAEGDFTAQGDVNFWLLDSIPEGCKEVAVQAQLAPGTTKGSRHVIKASDVGAVRMFRLPSPNDLQGPVIVAEAPFTVEHPEHGDKTFPAGIRFVTYQRAHADELRRVAD
jgi:hypothetical protein